jgi:aminoglycoside phosphotransferase (APT) family kinase protein
MPEGIEPVTGIKEVDPQHQLDEASLETWLKQNLDDFEGPLTLREFRGGQSNPTYHLSDPHRQWVLRRKPPGQLLASAHAVDREFTIISALGQAGFPVPKARLMCNDESVTGTIFYVMDLVEGRVLGDQLLPGLSPRERSSIYDSKIEILAELHAIDHEAIGLADFGKPGNYFARQIHRWGVQYKASETHPIPAMDRLMEWLPNNIPDEDSVSIAHGDYGLNNMIVHPTEPRVIAILDWELSTIGHPLGDLTYHLSARHSRDSGFATLSDDELRSMGIPTEDEYVARYCELSGRDGISDLDFYLAFHLFRSASIMQGIAARVKEGTAAGEGAIEIGMRARPLAERALEHAQKLGA